MVARGKKEPVVKRLMRTRKQFVPFTATTVKNTTQKKKKNNKKNKISKLATTATHRRKNGQKVSTKVKKGRVTKTTPAKPKKEVAVSKKGNDRLTPRNIPVLKENPCLSSKPTDFVSVSTAHRELLRTILNQDIKALRNVVQSGKIRDDDFNKTYSYGDSRNADEMILDTTNQNLMEEYYKLKEKLNRHKFIQREVNLLQKKSSGVPNFYMLGRATRPVEATRGGREGNNALVETYGARTEHVVEAEFLCERNTPYKQIVKLSQMKQSPLLQHQLKSHLVSAVRMGHLDLSHCLAEGPCNYSTNVLHRLTLQKRCVLPEKILPISVLKKAHGNKNITPLHTAAINPNASILEHLSTIEPNINIPDTDNWYTIHYAAVCETQAPLKWMISKGISPNVTNKRHETPLHCAARAGRVQCIKLLLKTIIEDNNTPAKKSMVNLLNRDGYSPLHLAVKHRQREAVAALLEDKRCSADIPSNVKKHKITPFMMACGMEDLEMVKLLVAKDAQVESKDHKKRTPLAYASLSGQTHIVNWLLSLGADPLKTDSSGNSCVHYAAAYGHLEVIKQLAAVDKTVLALKNDWSIAPLSVAYLKGHYGIVTWMLDSYEQEVDISSKDQDGVSLLASLIQFTDLMSQSMLPQQLDYLISRGADCSSTDGVGNSIMHEFAAMKVVFQDSLKESVHGTKGISIHDYKKCFENIYSHSNQKLTKNQKGKTALHVAMEMKNLPLVKIILDKEKDKANIFQDWSSDKNILHDLVSIPVKMWKELRDDQVLIKDHYDVLPVLAQIENVSSKGQMSSWLKGKDSNGLEPVVELALEYATLAPRGISLDQQNQTTEFVKFILKLFDWLIQNDPECLTRVSFKSKKVDGEVDENAKVEKKSLAHISLNIPIESAAHSFGLLNIVLSVAEANRCLPAVFELTNHGNPLVIEAILAKNGGAATKLILKAAKKINYNDIYKAMRVHKTIQNGVPHEDAEPVPVASALPVLFGRRFPVARKSRPAQASSPAVAATKAFPGVAAAFESSSSAELRVPLLHLLIEKLQFDLIMEMNESPVDWLITDAEGNNALHKAAVTNHHKTVQLLSFLERKNVPIMANKSGLLPIHLTSMSCQGSADVLLDPLEWFAFGDNLTKTDFAGRTALHYAFMSEAQYKTGEWGPPRDPIAVVSVLAGNMDEKAINQADVNGNTALHVAAWKNSNISAVTLLRKGADVSLKNKEGNTPLALAVKHAYQPVALTLIQADSDITGTIYPTKKPLDIANSNTIGWRWLKNNEDKPTETTPMSIPFGIISNNGWEAIVFILLDVIGKNVSSLCMVISAALTHRHYNLARQLLRSLQVLQGEKPLHSCDYDLFYDFTSNFSGTLCDESAEDVILKLLLDLRVPLVTENRSRSLEIVIEKGHWELTNRLLDAIGTKLETFTPTSSGFSPMRSLLIRMNKHKSPEAYKLLDLFTNVKNIEALSAPLALPLPPELCIKDLVTPLAWAAAIGDEKLVDSLLSAGADVNKQNAQGVTALMLACAANSSKGIRAICTHGDKVDTNAKQKKNPATPNAQFVHYLTTGLQKMKRKRPESDSEDGSEDDESTASDAEESEESADELPLKIMKIGNQKLNLNISDLAGRNVLHYLISPLAHENVDMFTVLKQQRDVVKKLVLTKDKNGETPLDMAVRLRQRKMVQAMNVGLSDSDKRYIVTKLPSFDEPTPDVNGDAEDFIQSVVAKKDHEKEMKPHKNSGYEHTGDIVDCPETKQKMAVLLNKTELSHGRYGFHNFYRMQLIKRRDTDLWILFTNWGRIGHGFGEHQTTPFGNIESALKEFKSVYKQKTGQDWTALDKFRIVPKKYKLAEFDSHPKSLAELKLRSEPWTEIVKEPDSVRRMLKDIAHFDSLSAYAKSMNNGLNVECPLGRVAKKDIDVARKVLEECEKHLPKLITNDKQSETELLKNFEHADELASRFYEMIPIGCAEYSNLPRLDNMESIEKARRTLNKLSELEVATSLLAAAEGQSIRNKLDRIDYIKSGMECTFTALKEKDQMSQMILRTIENTSTRHIKIKGIFEIVPRSSLNNFASFADEVDQRYLWHGTKTTNLISILKQGFLVEPVNAQRCGRLFGDGVYFSDVFEKSLSYCRAGSTGMQYMLLNQVAVGNLEQTRQSSSTAYKGDTLHAVGKTLPAAHLTCPDGISMAVGPLVAAKKDNRRPWNWSQYSEFVVKDAHRILPRYIIAFQ